MVNVNLAILKNLNLLLVEDDEELREGLGQTLSIFFNKIFLASNGLKAIELFENNKIDMVITDYVMPLMDGHELCSFIRDSNSNIPLVIMSNYSDQEKLFKLITLELTQYLIKPVEYQTLIDTLSKMIKKIEKETINDIVYISKNYFYNFSKKELQNVELNEIIKLSKSEVIVLELLLKKINSVVKVEDIEFSLSPYETKK